MKKFTLSILLCFTLTLSFYSQIDLKQKAKDKVNERLDKKADETIDKTLDKAEESTKKKDKKNKNEKLDEGEPTEEVTETPKVEPAKNTPVSVIKKDDDLKSYSKFDFVAGEKVVYFDNFAQTAVGDFPANWNTSGSGEVTTNNKAAGKWLKLQNNQIYLPEINTKLPENFTLEMDVIVTGKDMGTGNLGSLSFFITSPKPGSEKEALQPAGNLDGYGNSAAKIQLNFATENGVNIFLENVKNGQSGGVSSSISDDIAKNKLGKVMHFSFVAQKSRLRFYIDEKKVVDVPKMLPQGDVYDRILLEMWGFSDQAEDNHNVYLSNIRLAVGLPDMRSKLITEGKFVTRGINFDSGSDKIKADSYGTLKEIAAVLKENPTVKVKIIGHTDNDGSPASNLELSKQRAAAVKSALTKEFGVEAGRMETDGKGQTEPSSPNTTQDGKANNRRVEFIKL